MKKCPGLIKVACNLLVMLIFFSSCSPHERRQSGNYSSSESGEPTSYGEVRHDKKGLKGADEEKESIETVEERLDRIEASIAKIERVLGLTSAVEPDASEGSPSEDKSGLIYDTENISDTTDAAVDEKEAEEAPEHIKRKTVKGQTITYASPNALYREAYRMLTDKRYKEAEKEFTTIAEIYPDHPLAVNAMYWMGECRYSVKDYRGSINIFKELVEKYPEGRKVPDALLKTAYAYLSIKDTENAREYLKKVVMHYPFSPAGEKAERKLKSLR